MTRVHCRVDLTTPTTWTAGLRSDPGRLSTLGDLTMFSKFVLYAGRIGWAIILLAVFAVILMTLINSAAR